MKPAHIERALTAFEKVAAALGLIAGVVVVLHEEHKKTKSKTKLKK